MDQPTGALADILAAAGLPTSGRFRTSAGWVSRAWIGDDVVVRQSTGGARDAYRHETAVLAALAGTGVPHARSIAVGEHPDGPWSVTERLPGRTLHQAWGPSDEHGRRRMIESLGAALRTLHRVPAPSPALRPPWLADAFAGADWPAYHPPIVGTAERLAAEALRRDGADVEVVTAARDWARAHVELFADAPPVLVHGDLHPSNVMVDGDEVSGLIDFAEAVTQPADVELDTLLRWCAHPDEFPPTPGASTLDPGTLVDVPRWLRDAYPELFAHEHERDRLALHAMTVELAIAAHHPERAVQERAFRNLAGLLDGTSDLDRVLGHAR